MIHCGILSLSAITCTGIFTILVPSTVSSFLGGIIAGVSCSVLLLFCKRRNRGTAFTVTQWTMYTYGRLRNIIVGIIFVIFVPNFRWSHWHSQCSGTSLGTLFIGAKFCIWVPSCQAELHCTEPCKDCLNYGVAAQRKRYIFL